jgi:hypothetical protein
MVAGANTMASHASLTGEFLAVNEHFDDRSDLRPRIGGANQDSIALQCSRCE